MHAATWDDDPDKARRAHEVARAVAAVVGPSRGSMRVLEYGAGTGLVTQALAALLPGMTPTLADNSSGMREVLARKVEAGALPRASRVWDLDLEEVPPPPERFDLVVSSMVLHHVHRPDAVLAGFHALLDEGGRLAVADLDREDGSFHAHHADFDGHQGFDRGELRTALERAGFSDVSFTDCGEIEKEGNTYPVFLAVATRPAEAAAATTSTSAAAPPAPDDLKGWLRRYLRQLQESLVWKLEGLPEYDVRRPLTPTGTNLLGLVKHLAGVELGYLGETFGRPSGIPLPCYDDDAEDNADMWATPEESREDVLELYGRTWAHGDATIAALDLDSPGRVPHWSPERADVTLGQILVHLVSETARHAGHADIVRELIDGATGLRQGVSNLPDMDAAGWDAYRERLEAAAREAGGR